MYQQRFNQFLAGTDTLQVYDGGTLVFSSRRDRLLPLMEYVDRLSSRHKQVVIFDKIMGNAAALLSVKAGCRETYSPLGSQIAIETFDRYGVEYHIGRLVPYIQKDNAEDMCPMEKLSMDKEPGEFYEIMRNIIGQTGGNHG